ncbi:uncharacterized protein [Typha angustifolia]|uniref:uncharacterized protein n=1 Tax=Typha angustifolia TaxID=59011 RepID=UPI003C3093DF
MVVLTPGVLLKLINGMKAGNKKPMGEHRTAVLQVTDILPIDLDEQDLRPKHGFYVKVSDSSHSIYVTLPFDQDELVLSNMLQLGQFINLDRLEPGSPVPVIVGTRTLTGRHPLVGAPELIDHTKLGFEETTPINDRSRSAWFSSSSLRPDEENLLSRRQSRLISKNPHSTEKNSRSREHRSSIGGTPKALKGNLDILCKEAMQQREVAHKVALRAFQDASAAETVVRILRNFSKLSRDARPEAATACIDQFLSFHQEMARAVIKMETVQAATSMAVVSERKEIKAQDGVAHDDHKVLMCSLDSSIRLAKKIRSEAGDWFVEFLDTAVESGLFKTAKGIMGDDKKSLMIRVIEWLEIEQSYGSKRPINPRASQIARKLRIRSRNF